ncbi:MAG TPA: type II secretion system protein [Candidatus Limnocylindria bacterium]|jgi:type II secretory pathway pseudopilin PulG|nr:type II secretion system protein [Candidatus Limnocylindria bacterium]
MKRIQNRGSRRSAFTMIELALCIAVVAIAMVAIIGVLPAGLGVQKQNREETVIDQDASLLMEAIRNGASGFDDLTNYVDYVIVTNQTQSGFGPATAYLFKGPLFKWPTGSPPPELAFSDQVLGLLSLPQTDYVQVGTNALARTNVNGVTAQFRAFSGALNEKVLPQVRGGITVDDPKLPLAFRYLLNVEIVPIFSHPTNQLDFAGQLQQQILANTLYDVRLTFQWPVFGSDIPAKVGGNSKSYRAQVSGRLSHLTIPLLGTNELFAPGTDIYLRRLVPDVTSPPAAISAYQPKS